MKPRIAQLMSLRSAKGEKIEIIKTIAPDWMEVGFLMDLDPMGRSKQSMLTSAMVQLFAAGQCSEFGYRPTRCHLG